MAEIKEVLNDIKDTVGDKGFIILIAAAAAIFIYNLTKQESPSDEALTTVTHVASYPDAVTNANVIIDTLQNSIDYSEQTLSGEIQGLGDDLSEYLQDNFEATNDYINDGLQSQEQLLRENFDDIQGGLTGLQNSVENVQNSVENVTEKVDTVYEKVDNSAEVATLKNQVANLTAANTQLNNQLSAAKTVPTAQHVISNVSTAIKKTTTVKYDPKSIVYQLKKKGIDSSMSNRKKIAKKNGIRNYTGTASQNTKMLKLLKAGKLKT